MSINLSERSEIDEMREEWTQAVKNLEKDLTDWSRAEGWQVRTSERTLSEESVGIYVAPDLTIETPEGEKLVVEVKGRGPVEASGRVQLSAWPTLFRVLLLHKPGDADWVIRTDSGIPIRQPWGRSTFVSLARDLLNAES